MRDTYFIYGGNIIYLDLTYGRTMVSQDSVYELVKRLMVSLLT